MRWLATLICWLILIWLGTSALIRLSEDSGDSAELSDPKLLNEVTSLGDRTLNTNEEPIAVLQQQFLAAPLSGEPFAEFLAASPSARRGLSSDRGRVAEHLLKVTPRSTYARISLAELDFLSGNYAAATQHISKALALGGPSSSALLDALAEMARNSQTRPFVASLIADQPRWSSTLIVRLASTSAQEEYLWSWADGDKRGEAAVVSALLRQNRLDLAYSAFLTFLEPEAVTSITVPYDANFKGLRGAGPFSWTVDNKAASFEPNGGLAASSYGPSRKSIARQATKIPAGLNRASIVMSGSVTDRGNTFEWAIYCYHSRTPLWTMRPTNLPSEPTLMTETFTVPENDCDFQRIELAGLPGDFPRTGRALIQRFEIEPLEQAPTE